MDFLKRWLPEGKVEERVAKHQCAVCGWPVPAGKGRETEPVTDAKGAICCNYCFENVILKAREAVNVILNCTMMTNGAEKRLQDQKKREVND